MSQTTKFAIFILKKNANDKIAKTLADEANVQLEVLNPLESLTQKQMDNGEDYLSVMKENLTALKKNNRYSWERGSARNL